MQSRYEKEIIRSLDELFSYMNLYTTFKKCTTNHPLTTSYKQSLRKVSSLPLFAFDVQKLLNASLVVGPSHNYSPNDIHSNKVELGLEWRLAVL